jgi:SulP family sulfate permease
MQFLLPAPFRPKLFDTLANGYSKSLFKADVIAGLTVAVVALPLSMALAIASGTTPDRGLITAVVAGFLISALGGSRYQIGGPTGAFVVVVFNVIQQHGYDGLVLATMMAGAMLIAAGVTKLGAFVRYMPEPVITGFTSGIALIIFSSQIKDLLGLTLKDVPAAFLDKFEALWAARSTASMAAIAVAFLGFGLIAGLRRYAPRSPQMLIAVVAASLVTYVFGLPIDTIGSRFGAIHATFPPPHIPALSMARMSELFSSAFTIAFLAGVESLLSAVVADGMTGGKHRSNCELVAQGIANVASALFGGMPATGAIARTATNIRSGAKSPVSGMLHAAFLLVFLLLFSGLVSYIPLASLAAVLTVVAWNMSEIHRFRYFMTGPWGDRLVLLLTFGLTVMVDLTVAIQVGVVFAAILFMHRMSEVFAVTPEGHKILDLDNGDGELAELAAQREALPVSTEVFHVRGPLFFGAASRIMDILDRTGGAPRTFILRMEDVPLVDASGAAKLGEFSAKLRRTGTVLILSGLKPQPRLVLRRMGLFHNAPDIHIVQNYGRALEMAASRQPAPLNDRAGRPGPALADLG